MVELMIHTHFLTASLNKYLTMAAPAALRRNSKPKVTEINGVLWQVDEKGAPIKKVRRKVKDDSESPIKSSPRKKEINGNMWEVDEKGNPIKRLRKKGEKSGSSGLGQSMHVTSTSKNMPNPPKLSSRSLGDDEEQNTANVLGGKRASIRKIKYEPLDKPKVGGGGGSVGGHGRSSRSKSPSKQRSKSRERSGRSQSPGRDCRARSRSRGRDGNTSFNDAPAREARHGMRRGSMGNNAPKGLQTSDQPAEDTDYIDEKGRRVVIDADGNKIAFDKNGKKLRPKKKPTDGTTATLAGDPQLLEMQRQLQAAQEEVERLQRQTQKDQQQIAKATKEMEKLKRDHQNATEEKRQMDLQLKNFQQRLRDQEEALANMPKLNSDGSNAVPAKGDHLVHQITTLMDENNILLEKLAKEKAAAAEELKRKEEELNYLKMELNKLRAENDMLFRNQGAATARGETNPLVDKLLEQKQELEAKLTERIEKLQERVEVLQKNNETLNEDLNKATLEIHEDDDEETRKAKLMAQAVVETGAVKNVEKAKRASFMVNNGMSMSNMDAAHSASNALRMIYRGRQNQANAAEKKKTWF
jgi:predicted transcriptional regulator